MKTFIFTCLSILVSHGILWSPIPQEENIPGPEAKTTTLTPGQSVLMAFTSGRDERGRQSVKLKVDQPGDYTLIFENMHPEYSGHWIVWDCIRLKNENKTLWSLGDMETPPDFSDAASDEFCNKNISNNCQAEYKVGESKLKNFVRELNDNDFTKTAIYFPVNSKNVEEELTLELSTLYSTHPGAEGFNMRISLQ